MDVARRWWKLTVGALVGVAVAATSVPAGVESGFTAATSTTVGVTASSHFYRDMVLADGAVGYWRLGTGGPALPDSAGASDGRSGPTRGVAGALGGTDTATRFDGYADSVVVPDDPALRPTSGFTVEAWIKVAAGQRDFATVVGASTDKTWTDGYGLNWHSGNIEFWLGDYYGRKIAAPVAANTWTHVAATYDGATVKLYVDGSLASSNPDAGGYDHATTPLLIGGQNAADPGGGFAPGYRWTGDLDEVALYPSALTAAQVLDHAGRTTTYAAQVIADGATSLWRLGETTGSVAADAAGGNPGRYGATLGAPSALGSDADTSAFFDGEHGVVVVPDVAALRPTTAVSLEAWVKPVTGIDGYSAAAVKASTDGWGDGYGLAWNAGNILFYAGDWVHMIDAPIPLDAWSHVVGTYDGITARLYVDGALVASGTYTAPLATSTAPLLIGGAASGLSSWDAGWDWKGGVDEVAVYPTALDAATVARHWQAGR